MIEMVKGKMGEPITKGVYPDWKEEKGEKIILIISSHSKEIIMPRVVGIYFFALLRLREEYKFCFNKTNQSTYVPNPHVSEGF